MELAVTVAINVTGRGAWYRFHLIQSVSEFGHTVIPMD
jgi:hypothetical protein